MAVYTAAFDRGGLHLHVCSGLTRRLLLLHHLMGKGSNWGQQSVDMFSLEGERAYPLAE